MALPNTLSELEARIREEIEEKEKLRLKFANFESNIRDSLLKASDDRISRLENELKYRCRKRPSALLDPSGQAPCTDQKRQKFPDDEVDDSFLSLSDLEKVQGELDSAQLTELRQAVEGSRAGCRTAPTQSVGRF